MPSDISRTSDDLPQHYKAVVMQQGRVILDRDANAAQRIVDGRIAADALDEIGPCGTPDDGYAITAADAQPAVGPIRHRFSPPHPFDFLIGPGTMYVGGQRVTLEPPDQGQPPWSYFHQPDWLRPDDPAAFSGSQPSASIPIHEYVTLNVFEQEVGAVEDPDLLDVALGGPDTTARIRLMQRIVRTPVLASDCPSALAEVSALWLNNGFLFDPTTMRLKPQAALQVSFSNTPSSTNPCDPVAQGGYLGAENQLIRVQITAPDATGQPQFLWGYDNASVLYRVNVQQDLQTLVLQQVPVDAFHFPRTDQAVEVLRTATVLAVDPDATAVTSGATLVRCVAEATGTVTSVGSYDSSTNTVTLAGKLSADILNDPNPVFLRIWQGLQAVGSQPVPLIDPTGQTSPGVQVTITSPPTAGKGASLPVGAFWSFAVRPATPQAVYPERFLKTPQLPDGPRIWTCPLAVLLWPGSPGLGSFSFPTPQIIDCRNPFDNLVDLTKRRSGGCCTASVQPSDAPKLQAILDQAAAQGRGQPVAICFAPGNYPLPGPLRLTSRHSSLILEGCPGGVTIQADPKADPSLFFDGLIVLAGADRVSLRKLQLTVPVVQAGGRVNFGALASLVSAVAGVSTLLGVRVVQSAGVRIERCTFDLSARAGSEVVGLAVLLTGDCSGLTVAGCQFTSATPPTVTPSPAGAAVLARSVSAAAPALAPSPSPPTAVAKPPAVTTAIPQDLTSRLLGLAIGAANPPAAQEPGLVALYGIVVILEIGPFTVGRVVERFTIPAILNEACICDNTFQNLSFAVAGAAQLGKLALRGNRITSCFAGFWLEHQTFLPPSYNFSDVPRATNWSDLSRLVLGFNEFTIGVTVALTFPLPSGVDAQALAKTLQAAPPAGPASLEVTNNRIEAVPPDPIFQGGTALILLLNRPRGDAQIDTTTALVCASNELHGAERGNQGFTPVALIVSDGPTSLTGNLILSESSDNRCSLILLPGAGQESVGGLAVTGNVLIGATNLGQTTRFDNLPAPLNTWVPFNSLS
jgi:hypothetical protein